MCMGNSNTGVNAAPNPIAARMAASPTAVSSTAYTDRPPKEQPKKKGRMANLVAAKQGRDTGTLRSRSRTFSRSLKINPGEGSGINT